MENPTTSSSGQANDQIVINSGKRLTIENAADFTQRLRQGLAGSRNVAVEFEADVEMDITALQILCSACKTAAAAGSSFSCHGERPKALIELLDGCGARFRGVCKHNNGNICTWFGEGK